MLSVGNTFCYSCFLQLSIQSLLLASVLSESWAWINRPPLPQRRLKGVVREGRHFSWLRAAVVMWPRSLGWPGHLRMLQQRLLWAVFCTGKALSEQIGHLQSGFEMGGDVCCGYKQQPVRHIRTALAWSSSCISLCLYKNDDLNGELKNTLFPCYFLDVV